MTDLQQFIIDRLAEKIHEHERRNTPPGIFWREKHAEICKAAERYTRQQRRQADRQKAAGRTVAQSPGQAMSDIARTVRDLEAQMPPGPRTYHLSPEAKRWWERQSKTAPTAAERDAAAHVLANCRLVMPFSGRQSPKWR